MSRAAAIATTTIRQPDVPLWSALFETTKPGITRLVTITALVGAGLGLLSVAATGNGPTTGNLLLVALGVLVGTAMAAGGANALNMFQERDLDEHMPRTVGRPIQRGRLLPKHVLAFGAMLAIAGCLVLWISTGPVPAVLAAICAVSYCLIYTPSKTRTVWSTLIGTVPGALPPMLGWSAAVGGSFEQIIASEPLFLFALMTVWQIPHFLAIAWIYRRDYRRGGFRVLPTIDPRGGLTAVVVTIGTAVLIAVSLAGTIAMPTLLGPAYLTVAAVTGVGFAWLTIRFVRRRTITTARGVFFGSVAHLPLLMLAMVIDAFVRTMSA
ncbi:MAG: heme o synthase [Planctomycetota bacterium]